MRLTHLVNLAPPPESAKLHLTQFGFSNNGDAWTAPVTQTDPRLQGKPDRVALWFYADHHPQDFLLFQASYLNHALIRFVVKSNWYPSFRKWCKPGWEDDDDYLITDSSGYHAAADIPPFPGTGSMCSIAESLGSKTSAKRPPDEAKLRKYFADVYRAAYDMLDHMMSLRCGKPRVVSFSDESAAVMRYGGSMLLRGRIGDQEAVFCYGGSQKFDLPAVSCEFLAGGLPDSVEYTEADKAEAKKWHCDRIVWMDEETYRRASEFRANPHTFRRSRSRGFTLREGDPLDKGTFIQNWTDIERILDCGGAAPPAFVDALASLHQPLTCVQK